MFDIKTIITIPVAALLLIFPLINLKKAFFTYTFLCVLVPPVMSLYISDNIPLVSFQRIMVVSLAISWLVSSKEAKKPIGGGILCIFVAFLIISCLMSNFPGRSFSRLTSDWLLGSCVMYFLAFQIIKDKTDATNLTKVLIIAASIVASVGILDLISDQNLYNLISLVPQEKMQKMGYGEVEYRADIHRIKSSFFNPLALGSYLTLLCPIMVLFALHKNKWYWLPVIISVACVWFTLSRGSLIVLLVGIAIIARRYKLIIFISVFIILIAAFFFLTNKLLDSESLGYRLWLVQASLTASVENPFFGSGLDTTIETVRVIMPGGDQTSTDPMSFLLSLLVEGGWLTLLVFLSFWLTVFIFINVKRKQFENRSFDFELSLSFIIVLVLNLVLASFSVSVINTHAAYIFWIIAVIGLKL